MNLTHEVLWRGLPQDKMEILENFNKNNGNIYTEYKFTYCSDL